MNLRSILYILIGIVVLIASYLTWKNLFSNTAKVYNWDLELTKPLDYDIKVENISYFRDNEEIIRLTSLGRNRWEGTKYGSVLHSKIKDYLPDTVKLSWKEKDSNRQYFLDFPFPKQKVLNYWNQNQNLLEKKWGDDYPQGQLSLRLGMAPGGLVVLWFSDLDINTSNFAVEIESYKASELNVDKKESIEIGSYSFRQKLRFGTPYFYPYRNKNVINVNVTYYNGESNSINLKKENNSVLSQVNTELGWSLAKSITVSWFDELGTGFRSTYLLDWSELPIRKNYNTLRKTNFVYLLDRKNDTIGEWNRLPNKQVFELTESKREKMGK